MELYIALGGWGRRTRGSPNHQIVLREQDFSFLGWEVEMNWSVRLYQFTDSGGAPCD